MNQYGMIRMCVWLFITVLEGYFYANFHGFNGEEINRERVANIYIVSIQTSIQMQSDFHNKI